MKFSSRPLALALTTTVAFAIFLTTFLSFPIIPDGDSYFHLAVGRLYVEEGFTDKLEWARFSVMRESFGDKELLFHFLLAPFVKVFGGPTGGRVALAFFNFAIFATIGVLATRRLGTWGAVVPLIVYLGAGSFIARASRLRPELLALLLFMFAAQAASRKRYWLLTFTAVLFSLGYTAVHALVGLAFFWSVAESISERRVAPKAFLHTAAGSIVGLFLHPGFPSNLKIWFFQNVLYFRWKSFLDIGHEIDPPLSSDVLTFNLGFWFVVVLALWKWRERLRPDAIWLTSAIVFGLLYLLMDRMAIYFFPFAALLVANLLASEELRRVPESSEEVASRPHRGVATAATLLLVATLLSLPRMQFIVKTLRTRGIAEADFAEMAVKIPPGAKVMARWGAAEHYVFWAPQGRYLNVLDPIFMAPLNPQRYADHLKLLAGDDPDTPATMKRVFDSDYIAVERGRAADQLERRLRNDPRIEILHRKGNLLARVIPANTFVLEWSKDGRALPAPRSGYEGYVDLRSVARPEERCVVVEHRFIEQSARSEQFEISGFGPTIVAIDGVTRVAITGSQRALLGERIAVPAELSAGGHRVTVTTCRMTPGGAVGFYFLRKPR